jgi:hypothetical protein
VLTERSKFNERINKRNARRHDESTFKVWQRETEKRVGENETGEV